jgi:hypothetical protein
MKLPTKHIRASAFGLVVIAFFLPFVVVSCPDYGSRTVSGVGLAFGTTVEGANLSQFTADQKIASRTIAILAFFAAIGGIACSYLLKKKPAFIACAAIALAGIALMFLLRNEIGRLAYNLAKDNLRLKYQSGYWIAVAGFIAALVITLLLNPSNKWSLVPGTTKPKSRSRAKRRR